MPKSQAAAPSPKFDAVVTEEVGDDLLADGLLCIARHAHSHLLRPGGTFVPARARVYGALASVLVGRVAGFDLSAFNAFRSNDSVWVDLEHLAASDHFGRSGWRLLSEPVHLFAFDFTSEPHTVEVATVADSTPTAHLAVSAMHRPRAGGVGRNAGEVGDDAVGVD